MSIITLLNPSHVIRWFWKNLVGKYVHLNLTYHNICRLEIKLP